MESWHPWHIRNARHPVTEVEHSVSAAHPCHLSILDHVRYFKRSSQSEHYHLTAFPANSAALHAVHPPSAFPPALALFQARDY